MDEKSKRLFLKGFIKSKNAVDELITYSRNKFIKTNKQPFPLNNEFIKTWESYFKESKEIGAFETLKKYFPPLQYPVKKGISQTEDYINVTLRGKQKLSEGNLELKHPDLITLEIYESEMVGKIPVIVVPDNDDFNTIICAFSNKNEPKELPNSMGAIFIKGINNWHRIHKLKYDWLKNNPLITWSEEFKKNVLPNPDLFKDKLIVLSTKAYSSVKSEHIGISEDTWKSLSLIIRQEHECTHLFTLQYYGRMANNIHDEIVADYAGITKAFGQFDKEWFLQFMGLEDYPNYREGARLQNYKDPITLSKEAFEGLKIIIKKATDTICSFEAVLGAISSSEDRLDRIMCICEVNIITMASPQGTVTLLEKYNNKKGITV